MIRVSVAVEGDKPIQTYLKIASAMDRSGFYSLQFYEHLPFRPAWGLCFAVMLRVKKIRLGPVTIPAKLYKPYTNARFLALLHESGPGAVLGVSRGAYMDKASVQEVVETVKRIVEEVRNINWSKNFEPEIYVGTSGPRLVRAAATIPEVKGIVVDNLANKDYAKHLRQILDAAGRPDLQLIARPFTYVVEEGEEAEKPLLEQLKKYLPDLVDGSPMVKAAGLTPEDLQSGDKEKEHIMLENFAVYGNADRVLEKVIELEKAGVTHVCFGHPLGRDPVKSIKLLTNKVIPSLIG